MIVSKDNNDQIFKINSRNAALSYLFDYFDWFWMFILLIDVSAENSKKILNTNQIHEAWENDVK